MQFFQLLGEDQRLMVVFQMLVMATQVDKSFPIPSFESWPVDELMVSFFVATWW